MSNYFDGSGLTMFQCDVCGRKLNSVNYTNGMKFCAKCYQETFGSKITEDMLIDMIKKTGWTLPENKDFLINIDKDNTILNQQRRISELEEQIKNITKEIKSTIKNQLFVDIRSLFEAYASSLIDYCIWNKNSDENTKLYNNFKKIIIDRRKKVLELYDERINKLLGEDDEKI